MPPPSWAIIHTIWRVINTPSPVQPNPGWEKVINYCHPTFKSNPLTHFFQHNIHNLPSHPFCRVTNDFVKYYKKIQCEFDGVTGNGNLHGWFCIVIIFSFCPLYPTS